MTANNLGASHPLGVAAASLFFGVCQSLGSFLQQVGLRGQITGSIPYAATILASIISSVRVKKLKEKKMRESIHEQ